MPDTPALGLLRDLFRSRSELIAQNALLRQQLLVIRRQIKRPRIKRIDRLRFVLFTRFSSRWREAIVLVQPETVLRWHRQGFRLLWKYKSRTRKRGPRIPAETIELIRRMARENRLWGAERIRGELLKLGIRVSKRTIQRYAFRTRGSGGPGWRTFLRNHGSAIWACDFLQIYDVLFRSVFAFFIIEIGSRRVVHVSVTRFPNEVWVAQQLRNATPPEANPKFLLRDNDKKFGKAFDRVADGTGIRVLTTPYGAPKANAACERFLGSVRRECLDHHLVLGTQHLEQLLTEYAAHFNRGRPHQGLHQATPEERRCDDRRWVCGSGDSIEARPVLNGLHHEYRWAA